MRPTCAHCGSTNIKLRRQIIANGTSQVAWRCLECNRWAESPARWLKHVEVEALLDPYNVTLGELAIVADYRDAQACVVCGEPGELHHWAPQAYADQFGDEWYLYPMAPLCPRHHRLWHEIVTPDLVHGSCRPDGKEES